MGGIDGYLARPHSFLSDNDMQFLQTPIQSHSPSKCLGILTGQTGSQITLPQAERRSSLAIQGLQLHVTSLIITEARGLSNHPIEG